MFNIILAIIFVFSIYIFLKLKNIILSFSIMTGSIMFSYLVVYKIQIGLIFNELNLLQLVEFITMIILPIMFLFLYKTLRETKILNDWLSVLNLVIPHNIQKMVFVFLIGQLWLSVSENIFVFILFLLIATATVKLSRLHSVIVILFSSFFAILINATTFFNIASQNELFVYNNSTRIFQIAIIFIMFVFTMILISVIDRSRSRHSELEDVQKLSILKYSYLVVILSISYICSFLILNLYFSILTVHALSSLISIIVLFLISKFLFEKFDFLDFDDFYQRKVENVPIIISFIVLFVLVINMFIIFNVMIYIGLALTLILIIFVSNIYKVNQFPIVFNYSNILLLIIITLFFTNILIINNSGLNNNVFNETIGISLFNDLSATNNTFLNLLNYLKDYPLLNFEQIPMFITASNDDMLELFASNLNVLATIFTAFVFTFVVTVSNSKKTDYGELFLYSVFYMVFFLVINVMLLNFL